MIAPKSKQQKKVEDKVLPGGLVIVNPLPDYPEPTIYMAIVQAKFKLNQLEGAVKQAQPILWQLQEQPRDVGSFVDHFEHYNQFGWANTRHECEQNACQNCRLELCQSQGRLIYKTRVDRKFLENTEVREKGRLMFRPVESAEGMGRGRHKAHYGTIDYIDMPAQLLYVEMELREEYPDEGELYEAISMPSALIFRSRCRTLDLLRIHSEWAEYIFPWQRDALTQELISEADFARAERKFLLQTRFSSNRGRHFNEYQKRAIHAIVSGLHGPCPYILFGPPGTGKTVTLVEAIRLLLLPGNGDDGQHRRVLVCTPSNTAADAFTQELLSSGALPAEQMLRIFAMSKKIEDQNEQLQQHADELLCICYNEAGIRQFGIPPKEELLKKRVLICTLSASTYLVNGGLEGCFSHIIIDEAGQADELEALIPIVGLTTAHSQGSALQQLRRARGTLQPQQCHTGSGTRVVLAGDPQQLGPVQVCEQLKRMAKPVSLIERLIGHGRDRNFFHFDKRVTTMLEENYRSHPALITVPSQLYYGGKLRSSAPIEEKNSLCQWRNLPKKDFPLFWHSVEELEQCDENGHSYANVAECEIVEQYTTALVKLGVRPEEIGIITPYRYQIKMLRERCRHPKILIDSVERFQGSERRVIIISTVRSTGTGFLDCDKRFNTAVTRPKELLIIVGSSQNMRRIVGWNELIRYCEDEGALMGQTELRVVQKQQQQRHKMVPIPPSAMPSRKCRNQLDKVDALGRQLGSLDMAELVRNHRVGKAQNAGLFYRADEHRNRELEEKFIREWEERGRRQQFYDPSSSPVYAPSPCSGSTFHISASQVPSQYLGGSSTTGRNWELDEEDEGRGSSASDANNNNSGKQLQSSTKKCQIEAYTLEHAIASSGEELELEKQAENGHGKPKSNGDGIGIVPVKKPVETDEDDFKSCVSSHGHPTPSELEDGELDPSMELDEEEEDVTTEKEQNQQKEKKPADDVLQASSTSNSTSLSCLDQLAELQREMDKLRMQGGFKC